MTAIGQVMLCGNCHGCVVLLPCRCVVLSLMVISLIAVELYDAAVFFVYDISPISVTIREERRHFGHFLTRICAVIGGVFAVTGNGKFLRKMLASIQYYCRSNYLTNSNSLSRSQMRLYVLRAYRLDRRLDF